jgi:3-isopropylmalate/(R)-2-methylmalate dehydratase small subunit
LAEYGFRAILAPSFADIFYNNSFKNGLLPIVLNKAAIDTLFAQCDASEGYTLHIDLATQTVTHPDGVAHTFNVDAFRKHCLLNGLDDIGLTLQDQAAIQAFETRHRNAQPWLFGV